MKPGAERFVQLPSPLAERVEERYRVIEGHLGAEALASLYMLLDSVAALPDPAITQPVKLPVERPVERSSRKAAVAAASRKR